MDLKLRVAACVVALWTGCGGCDDLGPTTNIDCGNLVRDGAEVCDGADLNTQTCSTLGYGSGTLACAPGCGGFITAACDGIAQTEIPCGFCGAGFVCDDELCVPNCDGEPIVDDQQLAFDIEVAPLTGTITQNGEPLGERFRGELVLRRRAGWPPAVVPLADVGVPSFETPVVLGSYDSIEWRTSSWSGPPTYVFASHADLANDPPDFELPPFVDVTVDVLVGGTPLSDSTWDHERDEPRGTLIFEHVDRDIGSTALELTDTGPGQFSVTLFPGTYQVFWGRSDGTVRYLDEVAIEDGRKVSVDLNLVKIEGSVRVGDTSIGSALTAGGSATLRFQRNDSAPIAAYPGFAPTDVEVVSLRKPFLSTFEAWISAGPKRVMLLASVPGTQVQLDLGERDVAGALNFDVAATVVGATLTRNGSRLPRSRIEGVPRGTLSFRRGDFDSIGFELGPRGPGEIAGLLPPGRWEVWVSGTLFGGVLPLLPVQIGEVTVGDEPPEGLDFDVAAVRLAGQLSVNGARMPDEMAETRGALQLRTRENGIHYTIPLPPTGPALYEVVLAPGDYEIAVSKWWFLTGVEEQPAEGTLPLGVWELGELALEATTRRDFDLRIHDVEIGLTADGAALQEGNTSRGTLWFIDPANDRVSRSLTVPATGVASVKTTLYPGRYRIVFLADESVGGLQQSAMVLDDDYLVDSSRSDILGVGGVSVSGTITVNVEVPPRAEPMRGQVSLARFPAQPRQHTVQTDVASSDAASFTADVIRGHYDIVFHPSADFDAVPHHPILLGRTCAAAP